MPVAAQDAAPVGNVRLDALAQRYFAEQWRLSPVRATQVGVHDYDAQLGDFSGDGFAARIASARRYLGELGTIAPEALGADASYDQAILRANLQAQILQLATLATWKHDPSYYPMQGSSAVYGLIARDFAPLPQRMASVIARERLLPAMLAQGTANITNVDAVTAALAQKNIAGSITFFTSVVPAALAPVKDPALAANFKASNDAVLAALRSFSATMDAGPFAHPSGTYAIGSANFAELLRLQELTPIPLDTYERVGIAELAKTKAQFLAAAKAIDPSKTPEEVAAQLGASHPSADALLPTASNDLATLRTFVLAHHIVTLPPDNDVKVVATPEFARQTTFAAMSAPGPLETRASQAYYYVTPVEPDWTEARKNEHLSFFNTYYFPIVSAHEVMPGHYVNFAIDKHERLSTIRTLLSSPSYSEGWAHYDEQMMVDEGWGNNDPHVRLAQLQGALLRECRYLVGLREHTQNLSVDAATAFFEQNAFVAHEPAHREALRGTNDPLYGYYTLGKLELLKLREDYKRMMGPKYTLQAFHDQFLAHGRPPIAIVRKIMLGADDDGKLL